MWTLVIKCNPRFGDRLYPIIISSPESSRKGWLTVHVTSELSNTSFNTSNVALNCLLTATLPFIRLLFTQSSGTLSGIPPHLSPPVLRRLKLRRQIDGPLRGIVGRRCWLGIRICLWLVAFLLRLRVKGCSSATRRVWKLAVTWRSKRLLIQKNV